MGLLGQRAEGSCIQVQMLEQPKPEVGSQDRAFRSGGLCPLPSPALGAKGQRVYRQEAGVGGGVGGGATARKDWVVPGKGRLLVTPQ